VEPISAAPSNVYVMKGHRAVSEKEFKTIKRMQKRRKTSFAVATKFGLAILNVGRAFSSADYEDYLSRF
jgi:hypothetical protein